MKKIHLALGAVSVLVFTQTFAFAQVIGSYDNFDCFNDTGESAEGFEIDVEDVSPGDLIRAFPSNFSSTPWVIRYGLPTVTPYDFTTSPPDPQHTADAGHKGVLITWAANWSSASQKWVAQYGNQPYVNKAGTTVPAGDATPYVKNPTYTNGDSCWFYGLGNAYPTSGCDHFGISFGSGVAPGKIAYHWKVPDPNNAGQLMNWTAEASIPPSPSLAPAAGQPAGAVNAVAEAPDDNESPVRWGSAYFVKVTTLYSRNPVNLDNLQKGVIQKTKTKKIISYNVLQRPPAGGGGEVEQEDNVVDQIAGANVQVTKQYEYFAFSGSYDGETGQAVCDSAYRTSADAVAGTNQIQNGDSCSIPGSYWVINSFTDLPVYVKTNKGKYLGAHINAFGPNGGP